MNIELLTHISSYLKRGSSSPTVFPFRTWVSIRFSIIIFGCKDYSCWAANANYIIALWDIVWSDICKQFWRIIYRLEQLTFISIYLFFQVLHTKITKIITQISARIINSYPSIHDAFWFFSSYRIVSQISRVKSNLYNWNVS